MALTRLRAAILSLVMALAVLTPTAAAAAPSTGPLTNRTDVSFTSNGTTSTYHAFAEGLDWSESVGLLVYTDGSGGYGLDHPNYTYLLDADGSRGLVAVAREHNLLLVVPEAPAPGCPSDNCWYDSANAAEKARWSAALIDHIKASYAIDPDRIAVGGYSSGAQWTTRFYLPAHGERQSADLAVAIGGGGTPLSTPRFSAGYKADTVIVHNTGTADATSTYSAYIDAQRGEAWYRTNGFTTDPTWPAGVGHGRSGEFAGIMDAAITKHLPAPGTSSTPSPAPTAPVEPSETPRPTADYATTVSPAANGVTFAVAVPAGTRERTYVRLENLSTGREVYLSTRERPVADVTFKTLGNDGQRWSYRVYSGSSTRQAPEAEGTFRTLTR